MFPNEKTIHMFPCMKYYLECVKSPVLMRFYAPKDNVTGIGQRLFLVNS